MLRLNVARGVTLWHRRLAIQHTRQVAAYFSSESSTEKLKAVMEEYVKNNFSQELPSRALKLILKAADENDDGLISVEEVEHLLERIKVSDKMTKDEIKNAMESLGLDEGIGVPMKKIRDLFLRK